MKKHTALSSLAMITSLLTCISSASAQITITNTDMPSVGLTVVTDSDGVTKPLPGAPSATAQSWDFSDLQRQKAHTILFKAPGVTQYSSVNTFSSANLCDSTEGGNGYNFFELTQTDFSVQGAEEIVSYDSYNFQVELSLNPMFLQSSFPADYGAIIPYSVSRGSETFTRSVLLFSQERLSTTIEYSDTVDAWGTLKMPNGKTYPVLRQKHDEVDIDSILGYAFSSWSTIETTITKKYQYDWYANGVGYILVEMDMDSTSSTVKDVIWDTTAPNPTGINEISSLNGNVTLYPNPCTTQINFISTNPNPLMLTIYNITGQKIETVELKNGVSNFNVSAYPAGMYFFMTADLSGQVTDRGKFEVEK